MELNREYRQRVETEAKRDVVEEEGIRRQALDEPHLDQLVLFHFQVLRNDQKCVVELAYPTSQGNRARLGESW